MHNHNLSADQTRMVAQIQEFINGLLKKRFATVSLDAFELLVCPEDGGIHVVLLAKGSDRSNHLIRGTIKRHSSTASLYNSCCEMVRYMAVSLNRFSMPNGPCQCPQCKLDRYDQGEDELTYDEWNHLRDQIEDDDKPCDSRDYGEDEPEAAREYDENYLRGDPERLEDIHLDILYDEDPEE
jgi:hypothetical protein